MVKSTEMTMSPGPDAVCLLEPQAYMNVSGPPVRDWLDRRQEPSAGGEDLSASLLVVHDDLDLELGRVRFRGSGSSGGHRGVQSIIDAFATDRFSRLKVGIGRRPGADAADYVLEPPPTTVERLLVEVCTEASKMLPVWLRDGFAVCSQRFNGTRLGAPLDGTDEDECPHQNGCSHPGG
jgi:PTH1 family peptidyl-tRNA hydrolase